MISFLKKIIINNKNKLVKKSLNYIKQISELSDEIGIKQQELKNVEHESLLEKKDEMFISLSDFVELLDTKNFDLDVIVSKCKHISEIDKMKSSTIEVYSIVEDDHVILCPDVSSCDKHKDYKGDKIKITTIRR